ncbi:MAG: SDR family NAD(P)-dependent oxidoreductase [Deltaproteobacteria bacterium]|jgi:NAD(P)-dependent dehydrogenase (short-subunit alcohol dehydrogenase family)|nr:SDR family NAD(P)-dependent oxidoreductase [Deltaproteobacteria bacterium]
MSKTHPALGKGKVAVVTGAADGIGLAASERFAAMEMRVAMADLDEQKLREASARVEGSVAIPTDVSDLSSVEALREAALSACGRVDVLMNNAGIGLPSHSWGEYENWAKVLNTNLWGVINGIHVFAEAMIAQATPGLIINTGSKQGITMPPGTPAYNVSKAGVKATTEALAHALRNTEGCQVTAHLLVPGFTFTGAIRKFTQQKPEGAWEPAQVIDFLIDALARNEFYVICPDNDVDRETDNRRMEWAMGDLIHDRPALSRWHPDYAEEFEAFVRRR